MKDMFYNYDNCIDKKNYPIVHRDFNKNKILESDPNVSLLVDVKGNEIGLCARHKVPFELFFLLDGCVENSSIEELILNSDVVFTLKDYWHNTVLEKIVDGKECYLDEDTILICINQTEANLLKQETYYINLSLSWPGGQYVLYTEDNGFLTIK